MHDHVIPGVTLSSLLRMLHLLITKTMTTSLLGYPVYILLYFTDETFSKQLLGLLSANSEENWHRWQRFYRNIFR